MTLTQDQIIQYRKKYGLDDTPAPSSGTPTGGDPQAIATERINKLKAAASAPSPDIASPDVSQETSPEPKKNIFQKVVGGAVGFAGDVAKDALKTLLVKPAQRTAEAIGRTGILGEKIKTGYEITADEGKGQDLKLGPLGEYNVETVKPGFAGVKQIAGEGLKTASYLYTGGGAASTVKNATGVGFRAGTTQGAKIGAKSGAMYGAGNALEQDKDTTGVITDTLIGAGTGGLAGGILGGAGGAYAGRKARLATEKSLLTGATPDGAPPGGGGGKPAPDARVATKTLKDGKVVNDPVAKEAVRQGIAEADVALIKSSSNADKVKMDKMLTIRESQLTNKRITDRATDVVGDTFVNNVAKPIEKLNKEAGKKLEVVAQGLAGKKVDPTPAVAKFAEGLETAGITVRSNGTLNFKNSNFEGLKSAQALITNVWNRARRVGRTGDALQLHRTKSYIDEIVNYGKEAEGLSGKAQNMLKQFRHEIDFILDTNFPKYNKVNTQYAETINELNKMAVAIGRKFRLGDSFADAQSGVAMRRILSNTQSRAEILKMLDGMQKVAQKYGIKIEDDIITQANFADVLEKMLGSEAPNSFLGGIEKGLESFGSSSGFGGAQQIGSAGSEFARGNVVRGTIKAGGVMIDVLRGINQESKIKALRALLKSQGVKSVFGRPKI